MEDLKNQLKKMNVYWVRRSEQHIFANGELDKIFKLLKGISNKNPNDNFDMMLKLINVHLSTGGVCEALASVYFKKGEIELMGIFLYDYTKLNYEELYALLQSFFKPQIFN